MAEKTRAWRRWRKQIKKAEAKRKFIRWWGPLSQLEHKHWFSKEWMDMVIGVWSDTPKGTHCWCCCNPRHGYNPEITKQEKLHELDFKEQIQELK